MNTEIIFTYDASLEKFKAHINQYRDRDLEKFLETLYMYIEIISLEEMNSRIHQYKNIDTTVETELRGVKKFATTIDQFLKKSGQINKT